MRSPFFAAAVFVALSACTLPADAATLVYDVTGHIDSNDFLIIHDSTLQWQHTDTGGAAVGRHSGNNFPTLLSSTLDGVTHLPPTNWTPTWPQPVPNDIRFDAFSSVFSDLSPGLPGFQPLSVQATVLTGRGSLTVTQLPVAANDYTLIVRFSDGFNGSQDLRGLITVITPEPTCLTAVFALPLLLRRKRLAN